ncbi:MAG: helix-turn-helix transcriptional regulator [Oleiphilaceae bacterium]|nr:helix-turn-helix transcriptional regulator [Oleiphilaceae bacterium]
MKWEDVDSQNCSMARGLAIFGDRWTLLIIRECFRRVRRFSDFQKSLGITKHRLSNRLTRLVDEGILTKVPYDDSAKRFEYRLTDKGLELYPILMSVALWGDKWLSDEDGAPVIYRHKSCGEITQPKFVCDCCGDDIHARDIDAIAGPGVTKKLASNIKA